MNETFIAKLYGVTFVARDRQMTDQQYQVLASVIGIDKVAKYYFIFSLREYQKLPFRKIGQRVNVTKDTARNIYKKVVLFLDTWESTNDKYRI